MSLSEKLIEHIRDNGPLTVAEYMGACLYDPDDGYYATRPGIGGASADFLTAPEASQMFGEMIGLWLVQAWADQGCPKHPRLVELGPGRGTLMADILRTAAVAPEFLADLDVVLIEASPALQQVQADKLRGPNGIIGADISWQAQFDDSLGDRPLFLVANEFFDALPVRQFHRAPHGWVERMVGLSDDGTLRLALAPAILVERARATLDATFERELQDARRLKLITKRAVTTHNSWTHNLPDFVAGERGTNHLYMHPDDAARLGLTDGGAAIADAFGDRRNVAVDLVVSRAVSEKSHFCLLNYFLYVPAGIGLGLVMHAVVWCCRLSRVRPRYAGERPGARAGSP